MPQNAAENLEVFLRVRALGRHTGLHSKWVWLLAICAATTLLVLGLFALRASLNDSATSAQDVGPDSGHPQPRGSSVASDAKPSSSLRASDTAEFTDLSELRRAVLPSIVTVVRDNQRRGATGFVIGEGLVATARHVVPPGCKASVILQDGEIWSVEDVAYDSARDIAVLRIHTKRRIEPLKLATALPAPNQRVVSFRPWGGELLGEVTSVNTQLIGTTLKVVPGWSGSPVINMQGKVVGMNVQGQGEPFAFAGTSVFGGSAVVPSSFLRELLISPRKVGP